MTRARDRAGADFNGEEIIIDSDADTSITADTDDQIDIKVGGTDRLTISSTGKVTSTQTGGASNFEIQTTADSTLGADLTLYQNSSSPADNDIISFISFAGNDDGGTKTTYSQIRCLARDVTDTTEDGDITFLTVADGTLAERCRIGSGGEVQFAKTDSGFSTAGHEISADNIAGKVNIARDAGSMIHLNILNADGAMQRFYRDGSLKGEISVSGETVSYGAFTGSHWTRLSDNSKPTILVGTVLESIDTMCDWYEAEFTFGEGESAHTERERCAKPDGVNVGDTFTYSYKGNDYTATLRQEANNKHPMCKISDTEDSSCVYGVFGSWKNELTDVNDIYVHSVGTTVVRVASGVTVTKGDLLSSKGDGTAKLQGDDIIKTKTIGKVLSNIKQETYGDGSYTVPCALYCG